MSLPLNSGQLSFFFCLILWVGWLGWLEWESRQHRRNLERFQLRIHVNGTRGKSGVTRLVAAGLRAGGFRVLAKVTGTEACWIDPEGQERLVRRRGLPNIKEMIRATTEAARWGANVLVCECMALQPELQEFCERRLMQSHIGVITNIRHDHEEIMGPDLLSIAASLGRTIPEQGVLVVTTETAKLLAEAGCPIEKTTQDGLRKGREIVREIGTQGLPAILPVTTGELAGFPFEVEAENVALALKVCELAGVERMQALAAMQSSRPDAGNLTVKQLSVDGVGTLRLIDAMAANDPDSTRILWQRYIENSAIEDNITTAVLLHSRADRRLRTLTLCKLLTGLNHGCFYLTGDIFFAERCLRRMGVGSDRIISVGEPSLCAVLQAVQPTAKNTQITEGTPTGYCFTLFAAGNRKGFVA